MATIGEAVILAPSRNVVPGRVAFTVDVRDPRSETLDAMEAALREAAPRSPSGAGSRSPSTRIWRKEPVPFDPAIVAAIDAAAEGLGMPRRRIISGAGHDACNLAGKVPAAMIFVPCKDGISHNESESATPGRLRGRRRRAAADGAAPRQRAEGLTVRPRDDFAPRIQQRLDALAAITAEPGAITRLYLTPEQARAEALVAGWMREAGLPVRHDAVGNLIGRVEGREPGGRPGIGSHLDTVRNAGRYDGPLGVSPGSLASRRCCATAPPPDAWRWWASPTRRASASPPPSSAAGPSPAISTRRRSCTLDAAGTRCRRDAESGLDPKAIAGRGASRRTQILGYVELHIEQGPMLEKEGLPVGVVTAIAGASRLEITCRRGRPRRHRRHGRAPRRLGGRRRMHPRRGGAMPRRAASGRHRRAHRPSRAR